MALLLTALILGGGFLGMEALMRLKQEPPRDEEAKPHLVVEVQRLTRQDYTEWLLSYGTARALRQSNVAAEVAGRIKRVADELEAGQFVEAGQELVWIDDTDLRQQETATLARLEQARAAYRRFQKMLEGIDKNLTLARLELDTARRQLERIREAVRRGAASASDLDAQLLTLRARERAVQELENQKESLQQDLEGARAELNAVEATLAQVRENLTRTVVRAPYAGFIVERLAQPGNYVAPGTVLFRIVDRSTVEVTVPLPAGRYGQVTPGKSVELRLREDGPVIWSGEVTRVAPAVDSASRMFDVYIEVRGQGPVAPVPPGAFVVAHVEARHFKNVFVIPRVALLEGRVFVVETEATDGELGVVRERVPEILEYMPDVVLVRDGFEEGEEVVVTNVDLVADGTTVRIYRREAAQTALPHREGRRQRHAVRANERAGAIEGRAS